MENVETVIVAHGRFGGPWEIFVHTDADKTVVGQLFRYSSFAIMRSSSGLDVFSSTLLEEEVRPRDEPAQRTAALVRSSRCISALVANACLAMSEPSNVQRVGKGCADEPFAAVQRVRTVVDVKTQLFRLGTPVRVDCREVVRDYIAGTKRSLAAVRWIVRGHWTRQPCGPGRSQRRLQWIEPYWKGADDLPINVRPHQLGVTP